MRGAADWGWVVGTLMVFAVLACGDDGANAAGTESSTSTGASAAASTGGPGSDTVSTGTNTATSSGNSTTGDTSTGLSSTGETTGVDPDEDPLTDLTDVELVASGFTFTEGPVWLPDDGALLFSDIPPDIIYRWHPQDGLSEFDAGTGANANGLTLDEQGNLIACEHSTRRVTRRTAAGTEVVADAYMGIALNSPNDAVVHPDGAVYFTDPTYGGNPEELGFAGVFGVDSGGTVFMVSDSHQQPNGVVLSPAADVLYVADTPAGTVTAYPVNPDGSTEAGAIVADVVAGADGMAMDVNGNLYVSSSEGVVVLRPDGTSWGTVVFPEQPANCTFGDADRRTLFVTARTSVFSVRLAVPGLPPP